MSIFNKVRVKKPARNVFNLSHEVKLTCQAGDLVPIFCEPVLPGDTFKVRTDVMARMMPMLAPIMHRCNIYIHWFFVPNRLLWDNWKEFITGGEDGTAEIPYPRVRFDSAAVNSWLGISSLADYLGFPVYAKQDGYTPPAIGEWNEFDVMPFKAYHLIYNEYYRNQNLDPEIDIHKEYNGSLPVDTWGDLFRIRRRRWEKDYFTSALPWTQRGPEVTLSIGQNAPIKTSNPTDYRGNGLFQLDDAGSLNNSDNIGVYVGEQISSGGYYAPEARNNNNTQETSPLSIVPGENWYADLTSITAIDFEELRNAKSLQQFLELSARGGARYIEQLEAHFGVKSSDARLQRPEYLGGGKTPLVISEVLQQSETTETGTPLGEMGGHGISVGNTHSFKRFFEEHGYVMGIMSILPRSSYQQGLPRKYTKFDRLDYYWPAFAHLGEQEIKQQELFYDWSGRSINTPNANNEKVFGYQSRYSEYKTIPSRVCGDMRDSLSHWHMGRIFRTSPNLNSSFVEAIPTQRIFAVEDASYDKYIIQLYHDVKALRPMPYFGTPQL